MIYPNTQSSRLWTGIKSVRCAIAPTTPWHRTLRPLANKLSSAAPKPYIKRETCSETEGTNRQLGRKMREMNIGKWKFKGEKTQPKDMREEGMA